MVKYVIGIDVGVEPSVCILNGRGEILSNKLFKKKNDVFDYRGFKNEIYEVSKLNGYKSIFIEDVHSVFSSSAKSNFNFGGSKGAIVQCVFDFLEYEKIVLITPKNWQKLVWEDSDIAYHEGKKKDTKKTSLACSKRVMGEKWEDTFFLPTKRSYVPNHNLIDSYLIAEAGRRSLQNSENEK